MGILVQSHTFLRVSHIDFLFHLPADPPHAIFVTFISKQTFLNLVCEALDIVCMVIVKQRDQEYPTFKLVVNACSTEQTAYLNLVAVFNIWVLIVFKHHLARH